MSGTTASTVPARTIVLAGTVEAVVPDIAAAGAIPLLVQLLQPADASMYVQLNVSLVLMCLAMNACTARAVAAAGAVPLLAQMMLLPPC